MNNIVILGHGIGVKLVIESCLKQSSYKVAAIVTHPYAQHESDLKLIESRKEIYGEYAYNIFNAKDDYGIELLESDDVNQDETITWIKSFNPAYVVSIGCRNIIRKKFLGEFPNRVINIHTTPLPKYRGAATDSWMILNNEWGTTQYGCVHYIDEGIDSGDIIATEEYTIPENAYPIDVFKTRMSVFDTIFQKAVRNLENPDFVPIKQYTKDATVYPRLYTPVDGRINFERFTGSEIVRFIYAFGYPHSGAFCFFQETKVNILKASFHTDIVMHSFALGLIFGKDENGYYKVAVKDGYIKIHDIEINGEKVSQSKVFRLGKYIN